MIYCTDSHLRHSVAQGGVALFCQAAEFTSNKLLSQTWHFLLTFNEVGENDHNRSTGEFNKNIQKEETCKYKTAHSRWNNVFKIRFNMSKKNL